MGAGVGRYQGIHGLIIDSLLSVQLVTADGKLITASASQNPDLFWGFRGAGMNFGVVVSATYRIYDLTNGGQVQDADFVFLASQNESFYRTFASLQDTLPPELSLIAFNVYNTNISSVSPVCHYLFRSPGCLIDVSVSDTDPS